MINSCTRDYRGEPSQAPGNPISRSLIAMAIGLALTSLSGPSIAAGDSHSQLLTSEVSAPSLISRSLSRPDSDGDGVANQDDLDDDNDGILDTLEGGVDNDGDGIPDNNSYDTDGDGTPDVLDLDSDNDGILDNLEARLDRDAVKALDLVPNGAIDISVQVGGNGIADPIETWPESGELKYPLPDTDLDGIPDFRDLDSDNDGIYDVVEAGGSDNDTDGRLDGFFDSDGKGVADLIEAAALPIFDTDGDGQLDFRDLDSDADTVPDSLEAGGNPSFPADSDGDGAPDYRESDSDGDGIGDRQEAGDIPGTLIDSDGDGIADLRDADSSPLDNGNSADSAAGSDTTSGEAVNDTAQPVTEPPEDESQSIDQNLSNNTEDDKPDRDGDGIPNQDDLDDDNDSILDTQEGIIDADGNGVADANSRDSDGDGIPDGNDLDSDNDGIFDLLEARLDAQTVRELDPTDNGAILTSVFVGANGVADIIESSPDSGEIPFTLFDTDGDGTPDFMDTDSDNDGIVDLIEAGGIDNDFDGRIDNFIDADAKGVDDAVQASALPRFDTDGDGLADYRDLDSDNDGVPDGIERQGSGPTSLPADTDGDGAADYREQDSDNDGVNDTVEAGPNVLEPTDTNGDGIPDFQDAEIQNLHTTPVEPEEPPQTSDHDGDGQVDSVDDDDDNDGLSDAEEGNGSRDSDSDGVPDSFDRDSDNDGVLDSREAFEVSASSGNLTTVIANSDGDSVPDYIDLDSDNDGLFDALEAGRGAVSGSGRLASSANVDAVGLPSGSSDQILDTDGDGVPDMLDLDSDNDGLPDVLEAQNTDLDLDGRLDNFSDENADGADDGLSGNAVQLLDTDLDRVPDVRDLDSDQDGLSDLSENYGVAFDQDNNGQIDNFVDANGDGLDDNVAANLAPLLDTDNDGLPNSIDLDSDGDGVGDVVEAGGVDVNEDNINDVLQDSDGDGIADKADSDITGGVDLDGDSIDDRYDIDFAVGVDSDGDGIIDSADPDSDGDGFAGPLDDANGGLSQGEPLNLPDSNGDGIPDTQQSSEAIAGSIETGLGGSGFGCSIASYNPGKSGFHIDPLFALLIGSSVLMLGLRRRRSTMALAVSACALSACTSLQTVSNDPDFNQRVYAGAGLLASQVEPDTDGVEGTSVDDSMSAGASLTLGYDINNRFSVEGHLADLGEATLEPAATIGYRVAGLSALFYGLNEPEDRSLREGFSVFGRLGVGALDNESSGVDFRRVNSVHLLAGAGMEYGFSSGVAVRAELVAHETDAKYAQLGLIYRFGDRARSRALDKTSATTAVAPTDAPDVAAVPIAEDPIVIEPEQPTEDVAVQQGATLDSDADGVVDSQDECLSTKANTPVKPNGCDLFEGAIEGIEFQPASDKLTSEATAILDGVAQTLQNYPDIRITIEAHTDNLGEATENLQLSKRRALSVARYLVDQGISGSRMKPQAFGESKPRTTNATAQGRAANRRVEFSILR